MKSFRKILFSVLALGVIAVGPTLRAQDDKAPPADAPKGGGKGGKGGRGMMSSEERIAQIEKAVGTLSDDQKAKIKDVLAKQRDEMQQAMKDSGGDRKAGREKMQELQKSSHDQIRAVLTPDQQKKFDDMPPPDFGRGKGGKKKDN